MSEFIKCHQCGMEIALDEFQVCDDCDKFKRVMDSIDYVGCRGCGKEIVIDKSDPIDSQLCTDCNGEY